MLGKSFHGGLSQYITLNISFKELFQGHLLDFSKLSVPSSLKVLAFSSIQRLPGPLPLFVCSDGQQALLYKQMLSDMLDESHGPFSILTAFFASSNIFFYSVPILIILGNKNKSNKVVAFLALAYWQPMI